MLATLLIQPHHLGLKVPSNVTDYYRDFQNINVGILSAQAALVALVYPLVIALVGLLFEARTTTGGRLSIFFRETEAIATGGSSLALCAFLTVQMPVTAQLPLRTTFAATLLNWIWFIANLFGLGFFLQRSFDFIRPQTRPTLLRRYAVNLVH